MDFVDVDRETLLMISQEISISKQTSSKSHKLQEKDFWKAPFFPDLEFRDSCDYSRVLEILWQLETRPMPKQQFLQEAQAIWVDIFRGYPERVSMLLSMPIMKPSFYKTSFKPVTPSRVYTRCDTARTPPRPLLQTPPPLMVARNTTPTPASVLSQGNSPVQTIDVITVAPTDQTEQLSPSAASEDQFDSPLEVVLDTRLDTRRDSSESNMYEVTVEKVLANPSSPCNIQSPRSASQSPASTDDPTQKMLLQLRKAYEEQQRDMVYNLNMAGSNKDRVVEVQKQIEQKYVRDFLQACSLDASRLTRLGNIYPNLRGGLFDVARLWQKYEATNYNYASTKKWTWKRSKLTEGTEMVKDALVDMKVKLEKACTSFTPPDPVDQGDDCLTSLLTNHLVNIEDVQSAVCSLSWLKNILIDVTNRLQKRNQMQRSQEMAAKRMKLAETQFRQFQQRFFNVQPVQQFPSPLPSAFSRSF